jgi:threonine aldolase
LEVIEAAIRSDDAHFPITRLIILENTHNRCGGAALSVEYTQQVAKLARSRALKLHLDGARIFNAAVALGVEGRALAEPADSVTFCLSKALCAPVGSVLCGDEAFIHKARRARKQLGGGMRQAGVLAAAGIVALETMIDRLAEDHERARKLAQGLREVPGIEVENDPPPTNMVYLRFLPDAVLDAEGLAEAMAKRDIKVHAVAQRRMRLVLHYWIDDSAVEQVVGAFGQALGGKS